MLPQMATMWATLQETLAPSRKGSGKRSVAEPLTTPRDSTHELKNALQYLWLLLAVALCLRLWVFRAFPSIYWADEIFQTQEPAHRLAFGAGVITWEYRLGMRSWVLPGILAGVMKATSWLAPGSSGYIFGTAFFFSFFSLSAVWFAFFWCRRYFGDDYALLAGFTNAIWFELANFGPRALSEVLAGNLLLPAIYFGSVKAGHSGQDRRRLFFVGLLLGLAACLRIQLVPAVLLVTLWVVWFDWRTRLLPIGLGILSIATIFGAVDALTWSFPFYSYIAYFRENILHHRAVNFGSLPWYYYLGSLFVHTGPLVLFALIGVRRSPILGWIILAVVLPHSAIDHKEFRYIYAALPLLLTLSSIGLLDSIRFLAGKTKLAFGAKTKLLIPAGIVLICSLALAAAFPRWKKASGGLRTFSRLSRDREACGLALVQINWWDTGGYTYLHRPIPMFVFPDPRAAGSESPVFNRVVAPESTPLSFSGYSVAACQNGVCLYRRLGTCQPGGAEFEINAYLKGKED